MSTFNEPTAPLAHTSSQNVLDALREASGSLVNQLGAVDLLVSVRDPESGEIVQWEHHASTKVAEQLKGAVSCPIVFEGKQIGYIDLRATFASIKPAQLMRVAQGFHDGILLGLRQSARLHAA